VLSGHGMRETVLIHGGTCTGAIWSRLTPHLPGRALAVDLPGRNDEAQHADASFDAWADSVVADIDRAGFGAAIMVGHSMGGGTLAALARRHPGRVAAIVYFSAVVPPDGRPFLEGLTERHQAFMRQHLETGRRTIPRQPVAEEETASPDRHFVREAGSSEALAPFFETVSLSGLANTRVGYVKLLRDQSLTPAHQDEFIGRLGALGPCAIESVDGAHMAMVSQAEASAAAIGRLAAAWGL